MKMNIIIVVVVVVIIAIIIMATVIPNKNKDPTSAPPTDTNP